MKAHFFCQHLTGEIGFSIEAWNEAYLELEKSGMSEADKKAILHPPACKVQCFSCMAVVGERQAKTKQLIEKQTTL